MSDSPSIAELQRRLLYTLLWPVASLCKRFQIPLEEVERLTRLAYYEELRRSKATQAEMAEVFGTSVRTVAGVSKQFRSDFLEPQAEVELHRQLEELLAEDRWTPDGLAEAAGAAVTDVQRALVAMVAAGRVHVSDGEFSLSSRYQSMVRDDLISRMNGLKHQLRVVLSAVERRFLQDDDPRPAVARTLSFLGRSEAVQAMMNELVRQARLSAIDVEESALRDGGYDRYGLTIAVAATEETPRG